MPQNSWVSLQFYHFLAQQWVRANLDAPPTVASAILGRGILRDRCARVDALDLDVGYGMRWPKLCCHPPQAPPPPSWLCSPPRVPSPFPPPPHAGCSRLPRAHACTLPPHAACRSHTSHADTLIAMHTRLSSPRRDAASPPPLAYPHARGLPPAPRRRSLTHPRAG